MCDLTELPFNHLASDEEFYTAITSMAYGGCSIQFEKLSNLKLQIFNTNIRDNVNIPSNIHEPDMNCDMYKNLEMAQVCDYHIVENFVQKTKLLSLHELSLLHLNVRSLPAHNDELLLYLKSMGYPFKVIGLSETWLKPSNCDMYNHDGYSSVHKTRLQQNGGGVSLLIDKSITFVERDDIACLLDDEAESVFIEIGKDVFKTQKKLIIGEIYRPPNTNIENFCTKMEHVMKKLDAENASCYFMGDFNINLLNYENHTNTNDFLDSMFAHGYIPLISRPTRVTEFTATLIDHIYTNALNTLDEGMYLNGIMYCDISDHFPVFHICKSCIKKKEGKTVVYRQVANEKNLIRFKQELDKTKWDEIYCENSAQNGYDKFIMKFDKLYKKCIPVKKYVLRPMAKPWMTECLLNSVKRKNKLYFMYIKNPSAESEQRYKAYRNKLTHVLRISQKRYIQNMLDKYNCDMKKSWKLINSIIDNKGRSRKLPDEIRTDEGSLNDGAKIADYFNEYFTSVGPKLARSLSKSNVNPISLVKYEAITSLSLTPVENDEMSKTLGMLKDTSCGYDGYKPSVVKYVKTEIVKPLSYVVNLSLQQGIFPDKLKHAIVTPIHKGGEKKKVENYRPISVLPVFSKVYERVMYNRLLSFLETNDILYKHQYGFRPGFSTDQALIHVTDNILQALDNKEHLVGVFMDLAKAFDTINHDLLIQKLKQYGIKGRCNMWFRSYLSNRCQQVRYNGVLSEKRQIECGVPQGSILGPLLFIVFINDLYKCSKELTLILFADDTNAFMKGTNINDTIDSLNIELAKVAVWFDANQLSLNIKKTHYMIFSNRHVTSAKFVHIKGLRIEQVYCTKFLGVFIDDKLTWKEHIMYTKNKISKCIGMLHKVSKVFSKNVKLKLYKTFIQPHLMYCNVVWCSSYATVFKPLEVVQKRALKIALNMPKTTPSDYLFKAAKVHDLASINRIQTAIFMYKYNNSLLPQSFKGKFKFNEDVHQYNTRVSKLHHVPRVRLERSKFSIYYRGVQIWNSIGHNLRDINTLKEFKNSIKKHFV